MTITHPVSLDDVALALDDARAALVPPLDKRVIDDALVDLCRAAYDVLVEWDRASSDAEPPERESWRTPLEELRVQAALAELELRTAGAPALEAADELVHAVTRHIRTARREVGEALRTLRHELSRSTP